MDGGRSDDTPQGFLDELRSAFWNRRAGQIALAVLLAQSALRLVTGLVAYALVPLIASFVNSNSESVLFPSKPPFRWEALSYLVLEFGLVLIVFFYAGRALRPKRLRAGPGADLIEETETEKRGLEAHAEASDSEESDFYTLTGERANPTEVESNSKRAV